MRESCRHTGGLIFNAGCGGNDYGLSSGATCVNLDISMRQCRTLALPVLGDVEHIPFPDNLFDVTVCVGAVINYVRSAKGDPGTGARHKTRRAHPGRF